MNIHPHVLLRAVRHYAGKVRTMRDDARRERFMNALPMDIRKDIGWPDAWDRRRG